MPTLRILGDGRLVYATPGAPDIADVPSFSVGGGDTVPLTLDYTAFLGQDATISSSAWSTDGGTLSGQATAGAIASARLAVPTVQLPSYVTWPTSAAITVRHVLTASDGRVLNITFRLYPAPR